MKKEVATKVELLEGGNTFKQGDETTLVFQIREHDKSIMDLDGATVEVLLSDGKHVVLEKIARVENDKIYVDFTEEDGITGHGQMLMEFQITIGEIIRKFPSDGFQEIRITPTLDDLEFGGVPYLTFEMFVKEYEQIVADTKAEMSADVTALQGDVSTLTQGQNENSSAISIIKQQDVNPLLPPFNAKGDGVTDDTTAIQSAIDSLTTGGRIILTKKFKVTTVNLKANVSIVGIGQEKSGFVSSSETVLSANAGVVRFNLNNFGIWGASGVSTAIKFSGTGGGVADFSIRDVYIKSCAVGISLFYCWAFVLDRVRMQDCAKGMRLESQTNQGNIFACSFKVTQIATELFNCNGINFIGCEFAGANHDGTTPITLYQSTAINFIGNYVEFFANGIPLFQIGYVTGTECSGISINSNYISHDGSVGIIAIYNGRGISISHNHTRNFTGYLVRDYSGNIVGLTVEGNASQIVESEYKNKVPNYGFFSWINGTTTFPSDTEATATSSTGILGADGTLEITTTGATQGYRHKVDINKVGYLTYEIELKSSVNNVAYVDFYVDGAYKNTRSITLTANTYKKIAFVDFINGESITYIRVRFSTVGKHNIKTLRAYRGIVNVSEDKNPYLFSGSKPTNGTFKKGDVVTNNNPIIGSYEKWVCIVGGTSGTWEGVGLIEGIKIAFGTEPPTTGTWNKRDKIYNTDLFAGGYEGWLCVESGTFGTATEPIFKPYGLISE